MSATKEQRFDLVSLADCIETAVGTEDWRDDLIPPQTFVGCTMETAAALRSVLSEAEETGRLREALEAVLEAEDGPCLCGDNLPGGACRRCDVFVAAARALREEGGES